MSRLFDESNNLLIKESQLPKDGLVFWASMNGRTPALAETGQTLTIQRKSGTSDPIVYGVVDGIPCIQSWTNNTALTFPATGLPKGKADRTMSIWAKGRFIFGYGTTSDGKNCYIHNGDSGTAILGQFNTSSYNYKSTVPQSEMSKWYCFACAMSDGKLKMYFNGFLHDEFTLNSATNTTYNDSLATNGWIGGYNSLTSGNTRKGNYASCRIYNRALSDYEIFLLSREFTPIV